MFSPFLIDNLLLFPTVKEFSKSVNSWWSYREKFNTAFFSETQCTLVVTRVFAKTVKCSVHPEVLVDYCWAHAGW